MKISRQLVARAAAGAFASMLSAQALADTATADMNVTLSIPKSCTLDVTQHVSFGTQNVDASGTLQAGSTATGGSYGILAIKCRAQQTAITVALGGDRTMSATGATTTVGYTLYQPTSLNWGTDVSTCSYSGTLTAWTTTTPVSFTVTNSASKDIAVCAQATIDGATQAGEYSDVVPVTVTY